MTEFNRSARQRAVQRDHHYTENDAYHAQNKVAKHNSYAVTKVWNESTKKRPRAIG
jgi:hypothetical protein